MVAALPRTLNFAFAVVVLVLALDGSICFISLYRLIINQRLVLDSETFLQQINDTLSLVKDAETGQRGYLLGGEDQFLEPYHAAVQDLQVLLPALVQEAGNVFHGRRDLIARYETAVQDTLNFLAMAIQKQATMRARGAGNVTRAEQLALVTRGKQLMDSARAVAAELIAAERTGLAAVHKQSGRNVRWTYATFGLATALNLALLVALYRMVWRDVETRERTARQLAESEGQLTAAVDSLRSSESRLQAVFNLSSAGLAQTNRTGKFTLANARFAEIVGYSLDDLLGMDLQKVVQNPGSGSSTAVVEVGRRERRLARRDGKELWVLESVRPIQDTGAGTIGFVTALVDITSRKQAEEELQDLLFTLEQRVEQRTAELEELNRQLEAFTYTVSHDLRAPLRGIQGFAEALREDYRDKLDDNGQEYLRRVEGGARRMEVLIEDLLAYSRLSRTNFSLSPVSLGTALQEAMTLLEGDVRERSAQITIPEQLPAVCAHLPTLVQVLQNLLSNALKFTAPGKSPVVAINAETADEFVRLSIRDYGIGIEPGFSERIFQVFERLHGQDQFPGTGIGLAIVKKGVERMGGTCGVESEINRGSNFWVRLRRAPGVT
ncbi:MAG: CHASE3 domain-containing protein [Verrucomicrobia bacterium]|nr:CHASE3 domain-containing protein [Verrucomicrobiota bacterium]